LYWSPEGNVITPGLFLFSSKKARPASSVPAETSLLVKQDKRRRRDGINFMVVVVYNSKKKGC
jgi:hypothetical protein